RGGGRLGGGQDRRTRGGEPVHAGGHARAGRRVRRHGRFRSGGLSGDPTGSDRMNTAAVIAALDLPPGARVDRRVPKMLLVEHGAPTATDKRRINEGIAEIQWVATLKPTTVGVRTYRDATREYQEIAVLSAVLRG